MILNIYVLPLIGILPENYADFIEFTVSKLNGVKNARVDSSLRNLTIEFNPKLISENDIIACLKNINYESNRATNLKFDIPTNTIPSHLLRIFEELKKEKNKLQSLKDQLQQTLNEAEKKNKAQIKKLLITNKQLLKEIKEKGQIVNALTENLKGFKAIIETLPVAIYLCEGIEQKATYVNPTMVEMFGYTIEDIPTAKQWYSLAYPDEAYRNLLVEEWTKRIKYAIENQSHIKAMESVVTCKDGSTKNILWDFITLHDKNYVFGFDMSAQKKVEQAMRLSEEYFRNIFEHSTIGKSITSLDGKLKTNNQFRQILGYSENELTDINWKEITHPDDIQENIDNLASIISGKKTSMRWEKRYIHKDGHIVWVDISTVLQCGANGEPLYFITSIQDITDKKKMEEALRTSEEDYRKLFENHSAIKFIVDPANGDIYDANYAAAEYYGWTREELRQMNISRINTLPNKKVKEAMLAAKSSGKNRFEFQHRKADGSVHEVEIFSNNIMMHGKEYLHTIVMDATERKRAEEKIIKANRIYAFISQINQAIVRTKDLNTLFKKVCDIAIEYGKFQMAWIGLKDETSEAVTPVAIAGYENNYLSIVPRISVSDTPEGRGPTGSAIREGKHFIANDIATNPTMVVWREEALSRGYFSSMALPISQFGEIIGAFSLYASISNFFDKEEVDLLDEVASNISFAIESIEMENRRQRAEEEIKKINETLENRVYERTKQLEAVNKELEAFSYSISHDLRAPLRHINGFISLFLENKQTKLTPEELGYLRIVTKSSTEMGELIDALLSFSRLNRAELQKTRIDTNGLVNQSLDLFSEAFQNRKIKLEIGELPEIFGDYHLMRQVWINLISNAIKYTSKKEITEINIGSNEYDNEYVFFVRDNGVGFNMKYKDKLFGVFQRLHKQRDYEGIGIGLANVHRIIAKHSGRCWAEGELNMGATFYFSIPRNELAGS